MINSKALVDNKLIRFIITIKTMDIYVVHWACLGEISSLVILLLFSDEELLWTHNLYCQQMYNKVMIHFHVPCAFSFEKFLKTMY